MDGGAAAVWQHRGETSACPFFAWAPQNVCARRCGQAWRTEVKSPCLPFPPQQQQPPRHAGEAASGPPVKRGRLSSQAPGQQGGDEGVWWRWASGPRRQRGLVHVHTDSEHTNKPGMGSSCVEGDVFVCLFVFLRQCATMLCLCAWVRHYELPWVREIDRFLYSSPEGN